MLSRETIAAYCIARKHTPVNTLCEQNVKLVNVKIRGTYCYQCTDWFPSGGVPLKSLSQNKVEYTRMCAFSSNSDVNT
jgi:hypothetical protein